SGLVESPTGVLVSGAVGQEHDRVMATRFGPVPCVRIVGVAPAMLVSRQILAVTDRQRGVPSQHGHGGKCDHEMPHGEASSCFPSVATSGCGAEGRTRRARCLVRVDVINATCCPVEGT